MKSDLETLILSEVLFSDINVLNLFIKAPLICSQSQRVLINAQSIIVVKEISRVYNHVSAVREGAACLRASLCMMSIYFNKNPYFTQSFIWIVIVLGASGALLLLLYTQSGKISLSSGRTNCESHNLQSFFFFLQPFGIQDGLPVWKL